MPSIRVSFTYLGQRCRERINLPPTAANKKYVANLKARIEHDIARGVFDYGKQFPKSKRARRLSILPAQNLTVGDLLTEWLKHVRAELEPETFTDYSEYCRNTWAPAFGAARLIDFAMLEVTNWIAKQTTSKKRILNLLTPLRQAFRYAVSPAKLLPADPLAGLRVKRPDANKPETIDPYSHKEVELVTRQLEPHIANMFLLWAWTGLREGELFALRWSDIDEGAGVLRITRSVRGPREKAPKTRSGRRDVKLLPPALEALSRQRSLTRLMHREVFLHLAYKSPDGRKGHEGEMRDYPATYKRFSHDKAPRRWWKAACEAAGVRYRFPRQLRHTYASWMLNSGESPMWVSRQMGHRDMSVTLKVYGKFIADMNRDAGMLAYQKITGELK